MRLFILSLVTLFFACSQKQEKQYNYDDSIPQLKFAVSKISEAIQESQNIPDYNFHFLLDTSDINKKGFSILNEDQKIIIKASNYNELMYAGFEVAEQIQLYKEVRAVNSEPYIERRGIKFNIPLDARTPSYDDTGDSAQNNYAVMWEWEFWESYLDQLALDRYNVLTLWNPHPFPSMVKLEKYPDVALEDVYVTTLIPTGKENEWAEPQMVSRNVFENLKKIKTLSIDEKIAFWKKVMDHAKNRGIDIYFFTWNVCPNSVAKPVEPFYRTYAQDLWDEEPGKYGITNQMNNPLNIEYYRETVKQFLLTYPQVKGIGVTAGEHMRDSLGVFKREEWIWKAYGEAMQDVQKLQPERKIDFIHRVWNTDMHKIMNYWSNYSGSFEASFKYAKARLYSSPQLDFAKDHIEAMKEFGLKSWWNLRNDDIFVYRWGDPDYVRAFIEYFPKEHTAGFYMGSDGYVWGKEFTSKSPELSGELEITKHWYNFMMWGRLAYDNTLDKTFFVKKLANHFPDANAQLLYETWQTASQIIPQVNRFHWRDWDYQWAPEACFDERNGFNKVTDFVANPTMLNSTILNPIQFVEATLEGKPISEKSPGDIMQNLANFSSKTLEGVSNLKEEKATKEFRTLLDDMTAMAHLGQYYANKIGAATALAFYQKTGKQSHKNDAIKMLEDAVVNWEDYARVSEANYKPQMLARTHMLDWSALLQNVKDDVELVKNLK